MTQAAGWRPDFFGPFERYRRDLAEGFFVLVSPTLQRAGGGWTWELWGAGGYEDGTREYLAVGLRDHYATPQDAQQDADRVVQRLTGRTEEERAARGVAWPSPSVLTPVTLTGTRRCSDCQDDIPPGPAAQDAEGWLCCVSCACRNPANTLAGNTTRRGNAQRARHRGREPGTPGSRRSL
jgi:hypothetical protein